MLSRISDKATNKAKVILLILVIGIKNIILAS